MGARAVSTSALPCPTAATSARCRKIRSPPTAASRTPTDSLLVRSGFRLFGGLFFAPIHFRRAFRGARQVLVEVRQALHFGNVAVVHPDPLLRALPLTLPVLRARQRVLDLQARALLDELHALDDLE